VSPVEACAGGCRIKLRVQPRASRSELSGLHGNALKIRVTAPPVDGAANEEIVKVLAKALDVPRSAIRLIGGRVSRDKVVEVTDLAPETARARLGLT